MATNPERTSSGLLQINVINIQNNFPIQNARVTISYKGEPDRPVEQLTTNSSGQTEQVQLRRHLWNTVWNQALSSPIRNIT